MKRKTIASHCRDSPKYSLFLVLLVLFYAVYRNAGHIPIGGGQGWDGSAFMRQVRVVSQGQMPSSEPYSAVRMGGFIPAILATSLMGLSESGSLTAQTIINALLLALSAVGFFDFLTKLGAKREIAMLSVGTLVCSWPFLVMPIYYPMLSDPAVIALACLACWLWGRGYTNALLALSAFAPTVMPALFLVPLILAAMPLKPANPKSKATLSKGFLVASILCAVCGLVSIALKMQDALRGEPSKVRWVSAALSLILLGFAAVKGIEFYCRTETRKHLSFKALIGALSVSAVTHGALYAYVVSTPGFRGPDLVGNLVTQTTSLPFGPFLAHSLYYGPVFLVALALLFTRKNLPKRRAFPLFCVVSLFMPLLILGSESRQWLGVFPIIVACVALADLPVSIHRLTFIASVILCLPLFFLPNARNVASEGVGQIYFGRQGPWMSTEVYLIGLAFLLLYGSAAYLMRHSPRDRERHD